MQSCCEGTNSNHFPKSPQHESVVLSGAKISEMSKQIDGVKKFVFQIDKILLKTNPVSNLCFGNATSSVEKAEASVEVWQLLALMNGLLSDCLVSKTSVS